MNLWKLNFDGGITKNPGGTISYSYILTKNGELVNKNGCIDRTYPFPTTVNVAEFEGLSHGLTCFLDKCPEKGDLLLVNGDSQFAINMMKGKWKGSKTKPYYRPFSLAQQTVNSIKHSGVRVTFEWIPREENQECDDLAELS